MAASRARASAVPTGCEAGGGWGRKLLPFRQPAPDPQPGALRARAVRHPRAAVTKPAQGQPAAPCAPRAPARRDGAAGCGRRRGARAAPARGRAAAAPPPPRRPAAAGRARARGRAASASPGARGQDEGEQLQQVERRRAGQPQPAQCRRCVHEQRRRHAAQRPRRLRRRQVEDLAVRGQDGGAPHPRDHGRRLGQLQAERRARGAGFWAWQENRRGD